jgi:hypothetical protein
MRGQVVQFSQWRRETKLQPGPSRAKRGTTKRKRRSARIIQLKHAKAMKSGRVFQSGMWTLAIAMVCLLAAVLWFWCAFNLLGIGTKLKKVFQFGIP